MSIYVGKEISYATLVTAWIGGTSLDDALTSMSLDLTDNHRKMVQYHVNYLRLKGVPLPARTGELSEIQELTTAKITELNNLLP
tara:strand:- start:1922 stop:2173 length:252 start_codon:yes stop_codon:yes gene_type:complete